MKFIFTKFMYRAAMKYAKSIHVHSSMYINQCTLINPITCQRARACARRICPLTPTCLRARLRERLFASAPARVPVEFVRSRPLTYVPPCENAYLPACPRVCPSTCWRVCASRARAASPKFDVRVRILTNLTGACAQSRRGLRCQTAMRARLSTETK